MSVMTTVLRCTCGSEAGWRLHELAPGLPVSTCQACAGSLLALDDYRRWRDRGAVLGEAAAASTAADLPASEQAEGARHCPRCTRLMQRLRVGGSSDFRVDRCSPCQQVWLDDGEWPALVEAGLGARLLDVLSDAWQRQVQADALRAAREAALRERHGDDRLRELARIRDWLNEQPQRDELLALLRAGW
jgi:Zn-finger nucleic acid-binding protein